MTKMKNVIACLSIASAIGVFMSSNQSFAQNDRCNGPASYVAHAKNQIANSEWETFKSTLGTIKQARCVGTEETCGSILDWRQDAINSKHANAQRMAASYDELREAILCK